MDIQWAHGQAKGLVMAETYLAVQMCSVCALRPYFKTVVSAPGI